MGGVISVLRIFSKRFLMGQAGSREPVDMNGDLAMEVQKTIKDNKVVMYSTSTCPYCTMAKRAFKDCDIPYMNIEVNKIPNGELIRDILLNMTGARSVPRVFINGNFVGGGSEVKKFASSGELKKLFEQSAGAGDQ